LLGNRHAPEGQEHLPEFKRYREMWKIKVDKRTRHLEERAIAADLYEETKLMDIDQMRKTGRSNMKIEDKPAIENKENHPMNQSTKHQKEAVKALTSKVQTEEE
jgi:hypothetical protein